MSKKHDILFCRRRTQTKAEHFLAYSPFRAEYLAGGNVAGWQNNYLFALVRICRAQAGGKIQVSTKRG